MPRFENLTLKVMYAEYYPNALLSVDRYGNEVLYGVWGSIWSNATTALGIKSKYYRAPNNDVGFIDANGTLHGALGLVFKEEMDVTSGPIIKVQAIDDILPHSVSLPDLSITLTSGMRKAYQIKPLALGAGDITIITYFFLLMAALAGLATLFERLRPLESSNERRWPASKIFLVFLQTVGMESVRPEFNSWGNRFIHGSYIIFLFFVYNMMFASLKSNFLIQVPTDRIYTVQDVLDRKNLKPVYIQNVFFALKSVGSPLYDALNERSQSMNGVIGLDDYFSDALNEEMLDRKAVIAADFNGPKTVLGPRCDVFKGYFHTSKYPIWVAITQYCYKPSMPKEIIKEIDKKIRWYMEAGLPPYLTGEFDEERLTCFVKSTENQAAIIDEYKQMSTEGVQFILVMYLIMCAVCVLVFCAELAVHRISAKK